MHADIQSCIFNYLYILVSVFIEWNFNFNHVKNVVFYLLKVCISSIKYKIIFPVYFLIAKPR